MTGFLSFSIHRVGLPTAFAAALLLFFLAPGSARSQSRYGPFPWTFPAEPDTMLVGHCEHGKAEAFLDVGNVRASVYNNGNLFWASGNNFYEVPKDSGITAIFVTDLVIGGLVDGELRVSGSTYGPWEFWPGPIVRTEEPPEDCSDWDRFWDVRFSDLLRHEVRPPGTDDSIRNWPTESGASFVDVNGEAGYQPNEGDFPSILGDQMLWWIMNDIGNVHDFSGSNPLGLEIRVSAFAFNVVGAIGNSTFYRYEITNRTQEIIKQTHIGLFVDPDLGFFLDDFIGTDSTLGMIYVYNSSDNDRVFSVQNGYGDNPPALGVVPLEVRSSFGEPILGPRFNRTMYYYGGGGVQGGPGSGSDLYNLVQSRWRDGSNLSLGGDGRTFSEQPIHFFYPGDAVAGAYWSEMNIDGNGTQNSPADRRMLGSNGPIDLDPGETITITYAFIWSRGSSNLDSVRKLREDVALIKANADAILTPRDPRPGFIDGNPPEDPGYPFSLWAPFPNPASDATTIQFSSSDPGTIRMQVFDMLGRIVATPFFGSAPDGLQRAELDVSDWTDGVYTVRLISNRESTTKRLLVLH